MADMQIYLARPGGDREGPFSFQEILQDLQEGKYRENDFWAWYDGLPEWMPLHEVLKSPEVMQPAATAPISIAEPNAGAPIYTENDAPPAQPDSVSHSWAAPAVEGDFEFSEQSSEIPKLSEIENSTPVALLSAAAPEPQVEPAALPEAPVQVQTELVADERLAAGLPFAALERAFVFTTGEGRALWESALAAFMLKQIVGEEISTIRRAVPRDVIFGCDPIELVKDDGGISESVWRTMAARQPVLLELAKQKLYHLCVRSFRIEADQIVVLILFYNKQKL